jgi:hypothetical protein
MTPLFLLLSTQLATLTLAILSVAFQAFDVGGAFVSPACTTTTALMQETYAMTKEPRLSTNSSGTVQRALRGGTALLVVALLLGGLLLLVDFEEERPDFYAPARVPITEAATILSETYAKEKGLVQQLQSVHGRLDHAIALLGRAERLDPTDKRQIESLQVQLRALEDTDRTLLADPQARKHAYRDLTEQLHALAEKMGRQHRR